MLGREVLEKRSLLKPSSRDHSPPLTPHFAVSVLWLVLVVPTVPAPQAGFCWVSPMVHLGFTSSSCKPEAKQKPQNVVLYKQGWRQPQQSLALTHGTEVL